MKNIHLKLLVSTVLIITSVIVYAVLRMSSDASWSEFLDVLAVEFPVPLLIGFVLTMLYVPWGSKSNTRPNFEARRHSSASNTDVAQGDSGQKGPSAVGLDRNANVTADPSVRITDL